jgi:VWFA-related protein
MGGLWSTVWLVVLTAGLCAQTTPQQPAAQGKQPQPTFKVQIDLVSTDVIPHDENGNFVSDLSQREFEVYEDGVKQEITSMTTSHGGRVTNVLAPPPPVAAEGLILPPARTVSDVSGRIFVFFVDDLHLEVGNTGRVRELFKKISKQLVHEGDLFSVVSSGPSSIAVQMTYDKRRLDEAINKMTGDELKPEAIINMSSDPAAPAEVRYRVSVALKTVYDMLQNLDKVHDRRKALVYVSDGYDLNPFEASRLGLMDPNSPFLQNAAQQQMNRDAAQQQQDVVGGGGWTQPNMPSGEGEFSDADLQGMLAEVTREANRANVTMYTIDPRGLVAGPDLDQQVDPQQWNQFIRNSQDTLRQIAEDTGGIAIVNQNGFDRALKRIDADSSDYYVLGYYSSNPDPTQRRRKIEVKVTRPNVTIQARKEYVLKTVPVPPPPKQQ